MRRQRADGFDLIVHRNFFTQIIITGETPSKICRAQSAMRLVANNQ